ncbi:putative uncharacterized protein DDB_G0277255 isoform X4 [Toxorhynchites rutilus septentrionalis]|uniref:putative uncharacterized protein DDB_G0277255 isoform X4 n=1 Tax=Toxorhynchites rutilus septentrionalis TaxID=329112 RepID=UPI00247904F9|nr:putative uncharacterized protein DDB_G0277255 isoform X4 [Toxorhynchites rutilus septentrionalis]
MMADTNSGTSGGGGPEPIPQWKKELIQRRKNLAKTIGAAATQVHDSASTVAAALTTPTTPRAGPGGNPFGCGQKDPSIVTPPVADSSSPPASTIESSASPAPLVVVEHKGNNSDSPASPTATTPSTTSLFGAPVFVGHSHSSPVNEQPPVLVKSLSATTNTTTRGVVEPSLPVGGTSAEIQPLQHIQSHSNDGKESTSSSANSRSYNFHSIALSGSSKGGGGGGDTPANSGPAGKYAAVVSTSASGVSVSVDCELTRPTPGETSSYNSEIGWKIKKNTSSASSSVSPNSSTKMVAASAEEIIYDNSRFVGEANRERVGSGGTPGDVDSSEELKYGPGIVSKLRCRYLSLALRQSANKQRPSLNNMRRATSLNNLLDEECEDLSEREHSIDDKDQSHEKSIYQQGKMGREQHYNQMNLHQPKARTPDEYISTFQKSVQNCYTRSSRQTSKKNEYNRYNKQRGADSLKRALSVEALVRYDHKSWERDVQKENLYSSNDSNVIILDEICTNGTTITNNNCQSLVMNNNHNKVDLIVDCVTIEEKIINGREKGDPKPKRLTSFIDADERPPPDLVRQTLKIFEANANRKPVARTNGTASDVAAKVACYKSIISQDKPPITHPKPPLSPKKPNIIPRTTSPKSNGTTNNSTANGLKDKQNLPKLDITAIRNNLVDTTNNLKNTQVTTTTPPSHNQNNTSTPLSVRVELQTSYRLKYDSPALSPNTMPHKAVSTTTTNAANRPESPRVSAAANMQNITNSTALTFVDSPSIQALTSKLSNLNIATSTPAGTRSPTPSDSSAAAPPPVPPRSILQYATSDEEDPDDPEDQQREYSINSDHGSDSQTDDLELDDEPDTVRKVSPIAMENISKAGVTTQFRFNSQPQNKSHLPSFNNNSNSAISAPTGGAKLLASKKLNVDDHLSSNSSSTSSSPITVPTAAAATVVITQKPPIPQSRESLGNNGHKPTVPNNSSNSSSSFGSVGANNNRNVHNSSNANTSVNSHGSKLVITASDGNNANGVSESAAPAVAALSASNVSSDVKSVNLTAREIEKNQINLEKNEESISSASAVGGNGGGNNHMLMAKSNNNNNNSGDVSACGGGDFFMAKWGSPAPAAAASDGSTIASNPLAGLIPAKKKVKAPPPPIETNTMVFNFSDRKEPVPDYIENDGIILRPRPRELPKPGESGFVVLGDLTLETSTDPDDSWAMGPPSPCDVEFENANILINGKSSMRSKTSRDNRFKIQFDDSLTSTFEYPSETSLLETTNGFDGEPAGAANGQSGPANNPTTAAAGTDVGVGGGVSGLSFGENGLLSHKNTLLSSMPLVIPQ